VVAAVVVRVVKVIRNASIAVKINFIKAL